VKYSPKFRLSENRSGRAFIWVALVVLCVGLGLLLRSLPSGITNLRPASSRIATLYFADGKYLFPVSRRMPPAGDLPRAALDALLAGPPSGSGLSSPFPPGARVRSFRVENGVASVDLSPEFLKADNAELARVAIVDTLTALPEIASVALRSEDKPMGEPAARVPLLYYATANGLAAVPVRSASPRAALETYLSGPSEAAWNGLPGDVRLLNYDYAPREGLVSLSFTYTPSVRALAIDRADRMRLALLGLIASLTEYRDVKAVRIDFEGRTRLGLGECSDLLLSPQPRPRLLNDERLLGR